jgi:uncharacterized protein
LRRKRRKNHPFEPLLPVLGNAYIAGRSNDALSMALSRGALPAMSEEPQSLRHPSPFHAGERDVQTRAGVREEIEGRGAKAIRDFMLDQHRVFFAALPFLVVGSVDAQGRPWASILVGRPGFVQSPDLRTLRIDAAAAFGDPRGANLIVGRPLGLLGIQPETRRRNRANGTITALDDRGFTLHVEQSFGNCPQYIHARKPVAAAAPETAALPRFVRAEGALLSIDAAALVANADTCFIATAAQLDGVDVSHRGGKTGFVRVTVERGRSVLTAPDFSGNNYFNTLGNIAVNPRAGLIFVDFATGAVLTLTGEAEIIWDGPQLAAFAGARRLLRFGVIEGRVIADAVPLRWSAPEPAPQLAATGAWPAAAAPAIP